MKKIFELVILLPILVSCSGHGQESTNPLLGSGRGVDHMGILVKDLEITCRDWHVRGKGDNDGAHGCLQSDFLFCFCGHGIR